jgi:hypothetical protein
MAHSPSLYKRDAQSAPRWGPLRPCDGTVALNGLRARESIARAPGDPPSYGDIADCCLMFGWKMPFRRSEVQSSRWSVRGIEGGT